MILPDLLPQIIDLACHAGDIIMTYYNKDFVVVEEKPDTSPVTPADKEADEFILSGLRKLTPDIPAISEEIFDHLSSPYLEKNDRQFWLIDPLDGTRQFIKKNPEFTVNIALIRDHKPIFGVIHVPCNNTTFWGGENLGAWRSNNGIKNAIAARTPDKAGLTIVTSRSNKMPEHAKSFLEKYTILERNPVSSSLKFCLLAEGKADLYPRFGHTMEWDTAAGQAILEAAGGSVRQVNNQPLMYGKNGFINPFFVAWGHNQKIL
ncbi:MAG: 3'(2'),5'-bisphosphate nucleotidase CysQ [Alphaproteobacteria bacterium]|nr:3'(2'),5'-bisphosphate nucleotidase CysQ [Alphaproteobacteria bacterium]